MESIRKEGGEGRDGGGGGKREKGGEFGDEIQEEKKGRGSLVG